MQAGHLIGVGQGQLIAEQVGEKMVISIPATLIVQGDDEQVELFQMLEHFLGGRKRLAIGD